MKYLSPHIDEWRSNKYSSIEARRLLWTLMIFLTLSTLLFMQKVINFISVILQSLMVALALWAGVKIKFMLKVCVTPIISGKKMEGIWARPSGIQPGKMLKKYAFNAIIQPIARAVGDCVKAIIAKEEEKLSGTFALNKWAESAKDAAKNTQAMSMIFIIEYHRKKKTLLGIILAVGQYGAWLKKSQNAICCAPIVTG